MTEGTYLGLGEMKRELDYLRKKVELQNQMIIALCAPKPDANIIDQIADELTMLETEF